MYFHPSEKEISSSHADEERYLVLQGDSSKTPRNRGGRGDLTGHAKLSLAQSATEGAESKHQAHLV